MPNDSETATYRGEQESETHASAAQSDAGSNGYDSVAAQYNAIHEAQLAHEDTIREIREEIEENRRKLAVLESTGGGQQGPHNLDVILLRISELERKLGEGAPDPLLNEIVHRLAAIEQGPRGGQDARVPELLAAVQELKEKAGRVESDPRTDDVVLRLASLEGSLKRSNPEEAAERFESRFESFSDELRSLYQSDSQSLREQIAALGRRLDEASQSAAPEALEAVADRVREIEESLAERTAQDPRVDEALERLETLESKDGSASELGERLNVLASRLEQVQDEDRPDSLSGQIRSLESRLQDLAGRAEDEASAKRMEAVEERLASVEETQRSQPAEATERIDAAYDRLAALESKLEAWGVLGDRVAALEERSAEDAPGASDERLDGFDRRLSTLEGHSSSSSETQALVRALEMRLEGLTRVGGVMDLMAERVDRLEAERQEGADLERRLSELRADISAASEVELPADLIERLERLEARLEEVSAGDETDSRVSDLETRIRTLESKPETSEGGPVAAYDDSELRDRLRELSERIDTAAVGAGGDTEPSDLANRVAALEEKSEAAGFDSAATRELFDRVETLERSGGGESGGGSDPRVSELLGRLSSLEREIQEQPAGGGGSADDPRVDALIARLEALENASSAPSESLDLGDVLARIQALESAEPLGGGGPSLTAEVAARLADIEDRLAGGGAEGSPDAAKLQELVHSESDRWSQWARSTLSEVGELRQQVEALREEAGGEGSATGAGRGLSQDEMQAMGAAITAGLNKSDVKALRSQMYFVYFTIGMLWVFGLYLLFSSMAG